MSKTEIKKAIKETYLEIQEAKRQSWGFNAESVARMIAEKLGVKFTDEEMDELYPDWNN